MRIMANYPTNRRIIEILLRCGFNHVNEFKSAPHFVLCREHKGLKFRAIISKNLNKVPPYGTFCAIVSKSGLPKEIYLMKNKEIKKYFEIHDI